MISATITGNVGGDAETRHTQSGVSVTSFSVAVRSWKKDSKALWVKVTVWGKRGEQLAELVKKGKNVVATGTLEEESWTDQSGNERRGLALNAQEVEVAFYPKSDQAPAAQQQQQTQNNPPAQSAPRQRAPF